MKIYLNEANESWVVDRFRKEWIENNLSRIVKRESDTFAKKMVANKLK